MGTSLLMSLALRSLYANFEQFPISFRRNSQIKIATFYYNKSGNFCWRVPPEAPFYRKLLKIGIRSAKDIKICPHFSSLRVCPALPTPPVLRLVLLHTEASGKRLFRRRICLPFADFGSFEKTHPTDQ